MNEKTKVRQHIEWLKKNYFSDPSRQRRLEKDEVLLHPGQYNESLFLIREGTLAGYIEHGTGQQFEIFRSGRDNLVGAYSFFADTHYSYATVCAEEPTLVSFLTLKDLEGDDGFAYGEFAIRMLPVVVDEIYIRQLLAHRMSIENQQTMQRLHQAEKLATLGQLAAGLAHELNNALGVILRKSEWLAERLAEYIQEKDNRGFYPIFEKGLQEGQALPSTEVRKRKRDLEKKFDLRPNLAKSLAKLGATDAQIRQYRDQLPAMTERANYYYETGLALHDMLVAAGHATKVVQSVRELGVATRRRPAPTDIDRTVREALNLLDEYLRPFQVDIQLSGDLPPITANPSDWVQVWVNIVKNAAEALHDSDVSHPTITIRSEAGRDAIRVAIADNGPGIPAPLQEHIFQPNFTTKKEGLSFGLGLGLAIVQKIVETYRGRISVDSRPGSTTFTVEIPHS